MPLLGNTRKRRGFAYITVPEHVFKELLKLHGIEFNGRKSVIEKAKTPSKKTAGKNKQASLKSQSPVTGFEIETSKPGPPIQRITGSYRNAVLPKKSAIGFFSDIILKGLNVKSINKQVKGGRMYIKALPGTKLTQLNHYVLPTLEEYSFDAAAIQ